MKYVMRAYGLREDGTIGQDAEGNRVVGLFDTAFERMERDDTIEIRLEQTEEEKEIQVAKGLYWSWRQRFKADTTKDGANTEWDKLHQAQKNSWRSDARNHIRAVTAAGYALEEKQS